jgi:hypothetical protein
MEFDFSNFVDMGVIAGMIAVIQTVKAILFANKIDPPGYLWLIVVTLGGIGMGFIMSAVTGFNIFSACGKAITYAGAASLFYQHGKEAVAAATNKAGGDNGGN